MFASLLLTVAPLATNLGSLRTLSRLRGGETDAADAPSRKLAFLLDIDGTLAITDPIYQLAFTELLTPYGYDVTETWYKANVHGTRPFRPSHRPHTIEPPAGVP